MTSDPPVSFDSAKKAAGNPSNGGYPYQIRADDLDKNFVWATLEINAGLVEQTTGQGGHPQRKLTIPSPSGTNKILGCNGSSMSWKDDIPAAPPTGTHVLGAVNGTLTWLATEEC